MNKVATKPKSLPAESPPVEGSPAEMIQLAVSQNADLDKIERLLELQIKWEANESRKAYNFAMAEFKKNPLRIEKDKKVGYETAKGHVGFSHASLANVVDVITAGLSEHGLSASWKTKQNGAIEVTCVITHVKGHSEETTLSAPADPSGSKNAIQAIGSTITYLQRYTILSATGLAVHGQDDDGKGSEESVGMPQEKDHLVDPAIFKNPPADCYECSECAKVITKKVYNYSKQKFGKSLCFDHQNKAK